jgi:hypothetical protein
MIVAQNDLRKCFCKSTPKEQAQYCTAYLYTALVHILSLDCTALDCTAKKSSWLLRSPLAALGATRVEFEFIMRGWMNEYSTKVRGSSQESLTVRQGVSTPHIYQETGGLDTFQAKKKGLSIPRKCKGVAISYFKTRGVSKICP